MEKPTIIVKPNYSTYVQYKKGYMQEINDMLSDFGIVETPEVPMPNGAGVTLWEVISVIIITDLAKPFLTEFAMKIADKFVEWITERNKKGKGPIQKVQVTIYDQNGNPLKIVTCDKNGNVK